MATLQVVLLGSPQIIQKGKKLQIERRKSIALLAYQLLSGGPHSRDSLATMLWPENDQSGARANLRRELSRLRQEVGESVLLVDHDQVMINPGADLRVDVLEFQQRVKQLQVHGHSLIRDDAPPLCSECQQAIKEAVDLLLKAPLWLVLACRIARVSMNGNFSRQRASSNPYPERSSTSFSGTASEKNMDEA